MPRLYVKAHNGCAAGVSCPFASSRAVCSRLRKVQFSPHRLYHVKYHFPNNYLLSGTRILKPDATLLPITRQHGQIVQREDVNRDGVVDVGDLLRVATFYGQSIVYAGGKNPDVNGDGIINVQDIRLVTAVLDAAASAPLANPQTISMLTATDVQKWLTHAKHSSLQMPRCKEVLLSLSNFWQR